MRRVLWGLAVRMTKLGGFRAAKDAVRRGPPGFRARVLTAFGARIGHGSKVHGPLLVMGKITSFQGLTVGENTYVGPDCLFDLSEAIQIGSRVAVSARCTFITHLDVGVGALRARYPRATGPILIHDDAYLGVGATVLHGVTIGARSMVAAGALVRDDVPPDTLVAGVPARPVRSFTADPEGPA